MKRLLNRVIDLLHIRRPLDRFCWILSRVNPAPVPIHACNITNWIDRDELRWMIERQVGKTEEQSPFPSAVKAYVIAFYQERFKAQYFIETGTNTGHTLAAVAPIFKYSYSIEISKDSIRLANQRLSRCGVAGKVGILQGSSAELLPWVLQRVNLDSAILWLDAHDHRFDKAIGCPLEKELEAVLRAVKSGHRPLILIDDAQTWSVGLDWRPFIEHGYDITLHSDIWRAVPR